MAEAALSPTERALENQRIGGLQIRVAAICTVVQMLDAWDVNSIGVAVPQLTHVWHLPGPAFTGAFLWSSIGILVGALSAGPIGDHFGRKPLLIMSLSIFGLASLLTAFAGSLLMLTILRFFTGLGIGGGFPGAATLTGDYAPQRRRALMIMVSFTGAPLGGFLCGQAAGILLPTLGWPSIFVIGGVIPLVLVIIMAFWLPEVAALPGQKGHPVATRGGVAAAPRHYPGRRRRGGTGRGPGKPGHDAVQPGLRAADGADVDHLLLQLDESVPVRLLDARGLAPDRDDAGRGGPGNELPRIGCDLCGALSRLLDRPLRSRAVIGGQLRRRHRVYRPNRAGRDALCCRWLS